MKTFTFLLQATGIERVPFKIITYSNTPTYENFLGIHFFTIPLFYWNDANGPRWRG